MAFVVLYDAAVLYPAPLRDLLLRVARTGLVRAHWTEQILDECFRNILANRPDLAPAALERTRRLMNQAVPDVIVTGYESLVSGLSLPDADDRHVLAAAIKTGAQVIVTWNLADFPPASLAPYGIEAIDLTNSSSTYWTSHQGRSRRSCPSRHRLSRIRRSRSPSSSRFCCAKVWFVVARLRELMGGGATS